MELAGVKTQRKDVRPSQKSLNHDLLVLDSSPYEK
jgi:hypothetical protein